MFARKSLNGIVVVITGASSGIGRATAHAFASEGARLVLAARRQAALDDTAAECMSMGATAVTVAPTDVSDPAAVERLAEDAVATYGSLDVWINNAAVLLFGKIEEVPLAAFRRVVDVNLYGYLYGARAALRQFRRQRHGVLINNTSILGFLGWPYAGAYVTTKFAIRGLSECLRQEVHDEPGIHVCTLMPATVDTPIFGRAGNYTPWQPRAVPPVYDASAVARAMVALVRRPRRTLIVGGFGRFIRLGKRFAPGVTERIAASVGPPMQFRPRANTARPDQRDGNLMAPAVDAWTVDGGWRKRPSHPLLFSLALLAGYAAIRAVTARKRAA